MLHCITCITAEVTSDGTAPDTAVPATLYTAKIPTAVGASGKGSTIIKGPACLEISPEPISDLTFD